MKYLLYSLIFVGIMITFLGCRNREKIVNKGDLLGDDYRLFQKTPAWELAKAVEDNKIQKIQKILNDDPNLVNYQESRFGETLLMMTISNRQFETFKFLLEMGADVSIANTYHGSTALIEVCKHLGDVNYVTELLKYGADVNHIEIGPRKKYNSTRNTALIAACRFGHKDVAKVLVKEGAEINFKDEFGNSALSACLYSEEYDLTLYLLKNGVDYSEPIFYRDTENKNYYIRDMLKENSRPQHQEQIREIIFYLDEKENSK